ncbi:uncharacterized protein LOC117644796 [Thrips palmi]|uniref:Uncharacterized protein LOC117644796 n=1 Tax=Thrips palmi TaxID=161013 RepID=A0A6P8YTA0_THRPL|nr:uncharacterized protein LOC117644796 [Thrips palmi]
MAGSPELLKNALEDWLEQNFPRGYTSCIKIQGRPILPPLMSEERRIEMRRLRDIAVEVESRLLQKKVNIQDDAAGGEAMYEGAADELHFANSLPTSLAAYQEEPTQPLTNEEISQTLEDALELIQAQSRPGTAQSKDMLKEFDPLAEGNSAHSPVDLSVLHSENISERNVKSSDKTLSKPSSTESSIALSYSTDLNNYMDITEGSVDISVLCSDQKSVCETGATTPSTVRPDSAGSKSLSSVPSKDRKATFEDLNNYLDSLLNNNSDSKKQKAIKDSNQNVVNSSTSSQSSQRTISPPIYSEVLPFNGKPPPLTSPQGSLQTRITNDGNYLTAPSQRNVDQIENVSNFLQSCTLSPVRQSDVQNSYEQKVQLYLQNLVIDEKVMKELTQMASSQLDNLPQSMDKNLSETCSSKNLVNENPLQRNTEANCNGYVPAPPRLVRSNSYTLDSPSPMLLAHMEAELRKNVRNEPNMSSSTNPSQDVGPSRRVWDVESNKNMPSWCSRPSNVSNAASKTLSPKKVLNRSTSAQPTAVKNSEHRGLPSESPQRLLKDKVPAKYSTDQSRFRKSSLGSLQKDSMGKASQEGSPPSSDDSKDKARTLLLHLQLQHNQEMEELLNRQRKEKEAIRLALLEEQKSAFRASEEALESCLSRTSTNSHTSAQGQSPPTKDKALQMERRNTSQSVFKRDGSKPLPSGQVEYNKSSSISLDPVTSSIDLGGGSSLIDLGQDERALDNIKVIPQKEVYGNAQRTNLMSGAGPGENLPLQLGSYNGSSEMISSFPPSDLPSGQMERMTSSLPPEILSLHFSNTELTFQNANSVSCTTQSSVISISKPTSVSADTTSVAPNIFSSAFASCMTGGSPRTKRRSWCSRQLFPDEYSQSHPDWVTQTYELQKHQAASKIQAGVRGYLTRRLLKTERVQNCITTIRDTIVCALQLQRECAPHVEPSDLQLHGRLIQQLSAACEDLHHIFMGLPVKRRMAIIAADRERLRIRTPRSQSSLGSRPLSRATQIALQRKFNLGDPSDSASVHSRSSSANRSRRRSWAVESHMKASPMPTNIANNCEVVSGCLSRSSAPMSLPLQRSASAGSSRKPWR